MAASLASPSQRRVFGELSGARLSTLSATKNMQNAITDMLASPGAKDTKPMAMNAPTKRSFATASVDGDSDAENVDPALLSSKRSKGADGTPTKPAKPAFNLTLEPRSSAAQSSLADRRPATPSLFACLPTGASSAPAGRSPKHKRVGVLSRKRSSFSPFKRLEPPAFGSRNASSLPFSIDAALSGTLSASRAVPEAPAAEASVRPPVMPKGWFFDIHEDTPDEEAATIMEHSTCILDISSDDEAGPSSRRRDMGKENIPPADHQESQPATADATVVAQSLKPRRSVSTDAMADADRSPLGEIPAEDYFGSGLDATSVEIVKDDDETPGSKALAAATNATVTPAVEADESFSQSAASFAIAEDVDCTNP